MKMKIWTYLIFLMPMLFPLQNSLADTEVGGNITEDTTWTQLSSPYVVTSPVQVFLNTTLTIEPGVIIRFNGTIGFKVAGRLIAEGNTDNYIYFTSKSDALDFSMSDAQDKEKCINAYRSLKKIEAALESGINFRDYSKFVNEAKLEINMMNSELKRTRLLLDIYNYYQHAKSLWNYKNKDYNRSISKLLKELSNEYKDSKLLAEIASQEYPNFYEKEARQYLWAKASELLKTYDNL